ncbi:hypothetical protein GGP41_007442 [Bipolaris sorokiniana]|uniref:Uncharacterized protein n=1 Tax=Cochliobolus sativus TaxID=45130 RepID=A0A8H6E0W5_COCSA|nr:hypothetical protein GGP41_007442 [Bipolaris sorokiniana]
MDRLNGTSTNAPPHPTRSWRAGIIISIISSGRARVGHYANCILPTLVFDTRIRKHVKWRHFPFGKTCESAPSRLKGAFTYQWKTPNIEGVIGFSIIQGTGSCTTRTQASPPPMPPTTIPHLRDSKDGY